MNYQRIRLDTWLRTYALFPEEYGHWFETLEGLKKSKSVTFTLKPEANTTGTEVSITLDYHADTAH